MKPSKPNKSLILNALFVLGGKHKPHEILKWLDNNAMQPMDPDRNPVLSLNYYETRDGDDLGYEVVGSKPSNIVQEGKDASLGVKHAKTMTWRTVMRNLKVLVEQDELVEHDPKTGTYWLSVDIRNEIRYFGVWFGEVAVSRLFMSAVDMTDFINRIGVYVVYIMIEAMAPSSTKKAKDKDTLAEDWIESAIPLKTMFWRFVERFKGLKVVKGGDLPSKSEGESAYEMKDTSELESAVKRLNPEIYRILEETRQYMGIDRNKRSLVRKRPSSL